MILLNPEERSRIEREIGAAVDHVLRVWSSRTPTVIEDFRALLHPSLTAVGTGRDELVRSDAESMMAFFAREVVELPDGFEAEEKSRTIDVYGSDSAYVLLEFLITPRMEVPPPPLYGRMSMGLNRDAAGRWLVGHWHASVPMAEQAEGESFPVDALRARAQALEREVAERTADLTRANRNLQIEAALERVRARAMAMQKSDDLLDIVVIMRDEFTALGFEAGYFWHMRWLEDRYEKAMTSGDGTRIGMVMRLPRDFHAKVGIGHWEDSGVPTAVFPFDADGAIDYVHRMVAQGEFDRIDPNAPTDDDIRHIGGITFVMARTTHGEIGYTLAGVAQPSADALAVLARFAGAFDLAYRRFEDLRLAEAQAREAEIELALERVRARAMAMQTSEDLHHVVKTIFTELQALDAAMIAVFLYILDPETEELTSWLELPGQEKPVTYRLPVLDHPFHRKKVEACRRGSGYWVYVLEGDDKRRYDDLLFTQTDYRHFPPEMVSAMRDQERAITNNATTRNGILQAATREPLDDGQRALLERFARIVDLTYTRWDDLRRAEAQARETQVELALERIRARAMAMRHSDELSDTIGVLFEQLTALGVHALNTYLVLYDLENDAFTVRMTGKGGNTAAAETSASFSDMPQFRSARKSWESGEPIIRIHYPPDRTAEWLDHFRMHNEKLPADARLGVADLPDGVFNTSGRHAFGSLGITGDREATPEEEELLGRFAREFERAYQRFRDLEAAEHAAREARIEASMERVRARAMAMMEPEELDDVVNVLRDEFGRLGLEELETASIFLREGAEAARCWFCIAGQDGRVSDDILLDLDRTQVGREMRGFLQGPGSRISIPMTGEVRREWIGYCYALSSALSGYYGEEIPDRTYHLHRFSTGAIGAATPADLSEESWDVLRRGAGVFELAYSRFQDLQRAREDLRLLKEEKALTERTLAELRATQAQLVEQEKLASLGQLTAGIAHEIKNPLNFVNNFAEVNAELAEEARDAIASGDLEAARQALADLEENAAQIAKHGKRADSIVRAMMQHARGGASEKETIDVNAFLEEYAALAWHGMRARYENFQAELARDFDPGVGALTAMPQELGRVILNLLNNAFDALRGTPDARVTLTSRRTAKAVEITVSDNGPGIPPEIREKIFEPFFTTKPTGEGTGLGLSLSYDIVTKGHGGTMTVGTGPKGGAEFRVTVPA